MSHIGDLTRLQAVNTALSAVGQSPVATLGSGDNALATMAENLLLQVEREVQARGWWFNTETDVDFTPNSSDEVELGDDYFHVDSHNPKDDFVKRGNRLYDMKEHSFTTFTGDTVALDVIQAVEWLDTPVLFRAYCEARTARKLIERYLADRVMIAAALGEEAEAMKALVTEDSRMADHNFLSGNAERWVSLNYGGNGAIERRLV